MRKDRNYRLIDPSNSAIFVFNFWTQALDSDTYRDHYIKYCDNKSLCIKRTQYHFAITYEKDIANSTSDLLYVHPESVGLVCCLAIEVSKNI